MNLEETTVVLETEGMDSIAEIPVITKVKKIVNLENGLHARPSTELSRLFDNYDGKIEMSYKRHNGLYLGSKEVCEHPRSTIFLLSCALVKGSEVYLRFAGEKPSEEFRKELHDVFNNARYNNLLS